MRPIVLITRSDWNEPPRIRHQIANELSKYRRVFYVSIPNQWIGHGRIPTEIEEVSPQLTVVRLSNASLLPGRVQFSLVYLNLFVQYRISQELERVLNNLEVREADVITFNADSSQIIKSEVFKKKLYLCNDDFVALAPFRRMKRVVAELEEITARQVHTCLSVSEILLERLKNFNPNTHLFIPGHNFNTSHSIRQLSASPIRVGYMGYINDRLNLSWLERLTAENSVELHLIGPIEQDFLSILQEKVPNVVLHGRLEGKALQETMSRMNVLTIPYLLDERNRIITAPNKLFQYLAIGRPVVSARFPKFYQAPKSIVTFADNADDFVQKIKDSAEQYSDQTFDQCISIANQNHWNQRIKVLMSHLNH